MFVIGITGGIGSGKTAATDFLQGLGITIVDADVVARIVVQPGQPALNTITSTFGEQLLLDDGNLDRRALRDIVFNDKAQLKELEAITHPAISAEIKRQLAASTSAYSVLVSPLLFETTQHLLCHRSLLIDVPESLQLQRAASRDGANRAQIAAIMKHQMSRDDRSSRADDVLLNDGDLAKLHHTLYPLHLKYLTLARQHD